MPLASASMTKGDGPGATHLFVFPKPMVRRVIFGCRMAESKKQEIRQIIAETDGYEHVLCVQARIDERHYRILIGEE